MAAITTKHGAGGAGTASDSHPNAAEVARDIADDLANLRTKFNALLAKLDADSGVGDTNYVATCAAPALLTTKA